jgi:hypothetical protein
MHQMIVPDLVVQRPRLCHDLETLSGDEDSSLPWIYGEATLFEPHH